MSSCENYFKLRHTLLLQDATNCQNVRRGANKALSVARSAAEKNNYKTARKMLGKMLGKCDKRKRDTGNSISLNNDGGK